MFGDVVKKLRTNQNTSQVELAKKLGVSKQTVSNWENNNIQPSIDMLTKVAQHFSVTTDYLLELDDRQYLEVTGLSDKHLSHIQQLINDILNKN